MNDRYYVFKEGQKRGPYSLDDLLDETENGRIAYEDLCLRIGTATCEKVREALDWEDDHLISRVEQKEEGPPEDEDFEEGEGEKNDFPEEFDFQDEEEDEAGYEEEISGEESGDDEHEVSAVALEEEEEVFAGEKEEESEAGMGEGFEEVAYEYAKDGEPGADDESDLGVDFEQEDADEEWEEESFSEEGLVEEDDAEGLEDYGEDIESDIFHKQGESEYDDFEEIEDLSQEADSGGEYVEEDDEYEEEAPIPEPSLLLSDSTTILYSGKPSLLSYPKSLIMVMLSLGAGVWFREQYDWVLFAGIALALIFLLQAQLRRSRHQFYITPRQVEVIHGYILENSREVCIEDIGAIHIRQRGLQGLLGLSSIEFALVESPMPVLVFHNVRSARRIKTLVRRLQDVLEQEG